MKLSELEPAQAIEGEICDTGAEFEEDSETEDDLQEALSLLSDCLLNMESVVTRRSDRSIRSYPRHLHTVMEEVADFLEQWDLPDREEEERELSILDK